MGRRVDRIAALETKQERHTYKAKQHLLAIGRLPRVVPFSDGGQCTITEASVIGSDLKIVIELEKDGVVIPCLGPGDVLTIRNPGVCVEDPAGDVMLHGELHREDPWAVMEGAITRFYDFVKARPELFADA